MTELVDGRHEQQLDAEMVRRATAVLSADGSAVPPGRIAHAIIGAAARIGEEVTRRLDRVPEKQADNFYAAMGIGRDPARPARVPVAFKLADPAPGEARAPAATRLTAETGDLPAVFEVERGITPRPRLDRRDERRRPRDRSDLPAPARRRRRPAAARRADPAFPRERCRRGCHQAADRPRRRPWTGAVPQVRQRARRARTDRRHGRGRSRHDRAAARRDASEGHAGARGDGLRTVRARRPGPPVAHALSQPFDDARGAGGAQLRRRRRRRCRGGRVELVGQDERGRPARLAGPRTETGRRSAQPQENEREAREKRHRRPQWVVASCPAARGIDAFGRGPGHPPRGFRRRGLQRSSTTSAANPSRWRSSTRGSRSRRRS